MDLTPFLDSLGGSTLDELLLSVAVQAKVAIAMKGRFLLRAVTEEQACLAYLAREPYELLICTDHLESGNGFELARKARGALPLR